MALEILRSLPSYHGGKRRLLGHIFRPIPPPEEAPVFIDPFLGGGSVSLYAKARGYQVLCNDVAERSAIVGRALVENDRVLLTYDDLTRLFVPVDDEPGYAERHLAPDVFPLSHAVFLDTAIANARKLSGPTRWLSLLLVIKHALRLRPMGNFGAVKIVQQVQAGEWEDMNPHYVKDVIARGIPRHPMRIANAMRKAINRGVFSNGKENRCEQRDVFEFLSGVKGDVVYLDPPYSGTQSYEKSSKPLDDLLRGESVRPKPSIFSTEPPERVLPMLFSACDHIPTWVVSYGNQVIGLMELMDLVRRFRPNVSGQEIKHAHCTGLAGADHRARNRELVVVARRKA